MKLTDAGLETVLLFDDGIDLPHFASFPLVDDDDGRAALRRYYASFLELARDRGVPLVLATATWRASSDWGRLLGYDDESLAAVNRRAVELVEATRDNVLEPAERGTVVVEASIGPRGDAYAPAFVMEAKEAEGYHAAQLRTMADTGCTQATALTLTYADEASGSCGRLPQQASPSTSDSRSKPTAGCRAATRSKTRSWPWTTPRTQRPPPSSSTAPTRRLRRRPARG